MFAGGHGQVLVRDSDEKYMEPPKHATLVPDSGKAFGQKDYKNLGDVGANRIR